MSCVAKNSIVQMSGALATMYVMARAAFSSAMARNANSFMIAARNGPSRSMCIGMRAFAEWPCSVPRRVPCGTAVSQ